jgi:hypothetical protein
MDRTGLLRFSDGWIEDEDYSAGRWSLAYNFRPGNKGVTNMISTPTPPFDVPEPGSAEELGRFAALQAKLGPLARRVLSDSRASQTVIVVPSLTLDIEELAKIPGAHHY